MTSIIADTLTSGERAAIESRVAAYYDDKIATHGATPRGVDWNGEASQRLRFDQLLRLPLASPDASIVEFGCGYADLLTVLRARGHRGPFLGLDLVPRMIDAARLRHAADGAAEFRAARRPDQMVDYAFASGIFNVRLDTPDEVWRRYVLATLAEMHAFSRQGFAFNCLTGYADPPFMKDYLHYADPLALFDHCKRSFGGRVALLHDYPLYEFTILVPKAAPVA